MDPELQTLKQSYIGMSNWFSMIAEDFWILRFFTGIFRLQVLRYFEKV